MSRTLRALLPASAVLAASMAAALVHRQLTDPVRPGVDGSPLSTEDAVDKAIEEVLEPALPPATSPEELAQRLAAEAERFRNPPPTEHWLHDGAEQENKKARKDWIKYIHKAPPGVDWKASERVNGLAQIAKRNALAGSPPPPTDPVWVERGSANLAGRMHVARHGSDGDVIYSGSSKGGLWRGGLDGTDWVPLGDNLYGGVHWLEVLAGDVDGDPDVMVAASDSGLVHRSDDDGASWVEPSGLLSGQWSIRRLIMSSDGADTLYLVSCNWSDCALLRSDDTGASFEQIVNMDEYMGDVWAPRDGRSELYMVDEGALWFSSDKGETWEERGLILEGSSRGEIVGSEAGAPTLYVVTEGNELHRSDDAGFTWQSMHEVYDYWSSLNASTQDPSLFAWGGVQVYRSEDGGESFAMVNEWWEYYDDPANLLHADIPGLDVAVSEDGQEIWYICTDGGIYRSTDDLQSVENLSLDGLRVSQYYDTLTSAANPDHIAGGSQDQGYQITNTMEQPEGDLHDFEQIISGDYGHLTSSDGTHEVVFSVYPGYLMAQVGEDEPWAAWGYFPEGESYVPWLPPIVADPDDQRAVFFPATRLYRFVLDDSGWIEGEPYSDEGLELSGGEYVSALAFSPLDSQRAWLATSEGRLYHSSDHALTWTRSSTIGPDENWYYGQALLPSITDVDTVWVGGSGYGGAPAVYRSTDGGQTWETWSDGLPETMVYSLCQAPDGSGTLFAGTETAAYRRDSDGDWYDITGADAPVTTYWSCESLVHENTIRFGTYGRGIWDYRLDPEHLGCYPVQDYDGDGVLCDEDCDDHDATMAPGLEDVCGDGIDQDCDGEDASCAEPEPRSERPDCGCASQRGRQVAGLAWLLALGVTLRRRRA